MYDEAYEPSHYRPSAAFCAGIHPKMMSEMLGHSQIAITLDLYRHVTPQRDAVQTLDALLSS
jgi:site-specific recombinase XerD